MQGEPMRMDSSIPVIPLPPGLSWTYIITPIGPIGMAATPRGVCRVELGAGPRWAYAAYPGERVAHVFPHAFPGGKAIVAYLNGFLDALGGVPLDPPGTPFQLAVWQAARRIPPGQVRTYGELAGAIGRPRAARAVGQALGANPVPLLVPCHRVVAAGGALGGFTGGTALKARLLAHEAAPGRAIERAS
ncbi:MAG: methylated-DNA--[protein]-cysteine S-methyltransferase [Nitrospirae bacterium]|nr:methylated-DNA--[protein]-cysteine S-methyltransferase [Nitrospirota bacterium]